MTKEGFMKELKRVITKLPKEEQEEIIHDYEEYFQSGILDGKTEEEITLALGNPKTIGKEIVAAYQIEKVEENTSVTNMIKAIWLVIGLGFFNLVVVLGPFLAIAGLLFGVWVAGGAFILSPLLVFINVAIYPEVFALFDLFNAIALCGLGMFILLFAYAVTQKGMRMFTRYLKYNVKLVKGGAGYVE